MQITNVMAVSLDGRIATHPNERDGERRALGFTNAADFEHLVGLLKKTDAVIVGRTSLVASGGAFEQVNDKGQFPTWVVLTNRGLPKDASFLQQTRLPRWLVSAKPLSMPPMTTIRNLVYGTDSVVATVATALEDARAERVLLFGGGEINRLFYQAGLVKRLILTLCPIVVAKNEALPLVQPDLPEPVHFRLVDCYSRAGLVFVTYDVLPS